MDLSEFVSIPSFSKYLINKSGEVYNIKSAKKLVPQYYPNGYCYFHLYTDENKSVTRMRHRLLMITFNPIRNQDLMYVDHINGVKGDDCLENLRWVTPKENCEYAGKLKLSNSCKQVQVLDVITGDITNYASTAECARKLGIIKSDSISFRASIGEEVIFPENKRYRFYSEMPWKPVSEEKRLYLKCLRKRHLYSLDLDKDESYRSFKNIYKLCKYYKLSIEKLLSKLFHHPYVIVNCHIAVGILPNFTDLNKFFNADTFLRRIVTIYDINEDKTFLYRTASSVARMFNCNVVSIYNRCKTHGTVLFDGRFRFGYYPDLINYSSSPS